MPGNESRELAHVTTLESIIYYCICAYFLIREVKDRDEINEFLRKEIRLADMKAKVRYVYLPSITVLHNCL